MASQSAGPPRPRQYPGWNPIGTYNLIRREVLRAVRWLAVVILGPAIQAVLFASVFILAAGDKLNSGGIDFLTFLGCGLVMAAVIQRAFESTGFSIMFDKLETGGLQDLLGAPLNPFEILAGYLGVGILTALFAGFGIWLIMALFGLGLPDHPLAALFFMVTAGGSFSMLGMINAIFSPKWDSFSGKETYALLPILFLSGAYFPISAVPEGPWRLIFQANPVHHLIDGFRWAVTGQTEADPLMGAGIAVLLLIVTVSIAAYLLATATRLKP